MLEYHRPLCSRLSISMSTSTSTPRCLGGWSITRPKALTAIRRGYCSIVSITKSCFCQVLPLERPTPSCMGRILLMMPLIMRGCMMICLMYYGFNIVFVSCLPWLSTTQAPRPLLSVITKSSTRPKRAVLPTRSITHASGLYLWGRMALPTC